ncbi:uncharacterized protein LOC141855649 [Brevipalpus obovatus]|uniref:uncharacterized protein LOC141855649 n=1 Tax=Brevipalpus obovatus TaxID=246614 RepID=UPI003D9DB151
MGTWSEHALPPIIDMEPEGYMKVAYMSGDEFDPETRRELWRIAKDTEWLIHLYSIIRCSEIIFWRDVKSRYSVEEYLEACVFKHLFAKKEESWINILVGSGREKHHNLTDEDKKKILDHVLKVYHGARRDQLAIKLEAFRSKLISYLSDGPDSN